MSLRSIGLALLYSNCTHLGDEQEELPLSRKMPRCADRLPI